MSDLSSGGTEQFEFRGKAGEWFGIWIVNLLLSIITIGIYSAWAKVRTKKYFYNHTFVQGRNFDYHATGGQILIGRLIFIGGYAAFTVILQLAPAVGIVLALGLLVLIPWLIIKSMQFNARVSSFSNVRFNFTGKMGRAFVVFVLMPVGLYAVFIALGVGLAFAADAEMYVIAVLCGFAIIALMFAAFPIIDRAIKQFVINNGALGKASFTFEVGLAPFIKALAFMVGWIFVFMLLVSALGAGYFASMGESFGDIANGDDLTMVQFIPLAVLYVVLLLGILPAGFIYQALIRNVMFNNTTLSGGHNFRSTVRPLKLVWIALSNAVAVIFTLGLMLPWAHVRMQKYLASQTFLIPGGSLDDFIGQQVEEGMSVADAFSDIEGIDFGIPL
ncbi:YjgN family protein [uncultured Litoreibacter sp.]|uniref:YjgN family protein n=1 Tax=uncultured Litoreibacter sp. TaxID=1392394 RepID=UPI00260D59DB|nr:YjgN family protein [uncultured Litoreibacter sp.]